MRMQSLEHEMWRLKQQFEDPCAEAVPSAAGAKYELPCRWYGKSIVAAVRGDPSVKLGPAVYLATPIVTSTLNITHNLDYRIQEPWNFVTGQVALT